MAALKDKISVFCFERDEMGYIKLWEIKKDIKFQDKKCARLRSKVWLKIKQHVINFEWILKRIKPSM